MSWSGSVDASTIAGLLLAVCVLVACLLGAFHDPEG
jgi:hypothetical protein